MACPFFIPVRWLERLASGHPQRMPLGDLFEGICQVQPEPFEPPAFHQREICNCGYARGRCDRFPSRDAADAIRFSITEDLPFRLRLVYVIEKDHAPARHGVLEYTVASERIEATGLDPIVMRQAEEFVQSYMRRRTRGQTLGPGQQAG